VGNIISLTVKMEEYLSGKQEIVLVNAGQDIVVSIAKLLSPVRQTVPITRV